MENYSYIGFMEIWKDIKGYEGKYQVSNLGNIKSLARYVNHPLGGKRYVKEKMLKQFIKQGYAHVDLYLDKHQHCKIHRLVAKAFIKELPNKIEVNHIDGDKLNNNVSNLEWANRSENMKHCYKSGLWNNQYTINKSGQKMNYVI
jgi:hypothetical protein